MREEFEKLVATGKLARHHLEPLVRLAESRYCLHRSWGFGRITEVDTVFARFKIDFPGKPGHAMDLGFAADSLKPIGPNHVLAQKAANLEGLKQLAAANHLDLIKLVLESFGGKATLNQIQEVLVPDVIRDDWRKWWEGARRELKKDGHFLVPAKKSDPIVYQALETSLDERLLAELRASKGLKAKVNAACEALKNFGDVADKSGLAGQVIAALNADIPSHQRTQPATALEAIFVRDDLQAAAGLPPEPGALTAGDIWRLDTTRFGPVLEGVPLGKHRRVLQTFKDSQPETWHEVVVGALNNLSAKLCTECAAMLLHEGRLEPLKQMLNRLISQHAANSELLLWLAKERTDAYADILGPEVFRCMLTAMERDQFNEKRSNRLRDYILDDQELIVELIDTADLEVIKDLTRALQLSPCFDDMDKRSLLARVVKSHPAVQSLISGEQTRQETQILVSWESLEKRKAEYDELVQRRIPANSKEIAVARSYGDLSENHEYKAAKEMQKVLMRRKAELENLLVRARGTDFSSPRTDAVSMGTRVRVTDLVHQHEEVFGILGAWDYDPERGIISYQSPMAQAMIGRKPGDEVEFDMEGTHRRLRIESIEVWKAPEGEAPVTPGATPPPAETPAPLPPVESAAAPAAPMPAVTQEPVTVPTPAPPAPPVAAVPVTEPPPPAAPSNP
jgi:transcription elongation factor GreA